MQTTIPLDNNLTQITFIFVGNPARGDDAVGPMLYEQLETWLTTCAKKKQNSYILSGSQFTLINCFQLEPELCCDIEHSKMIIIIDASLTDSHQPKIEAIYPDNLHQKTNQATLNNPLWSHSIPPQALLSLFQKAYKTQPPPTYILHIPGASFSLGDALSETTYKNKESCFNFLKKCCLQPSNAVESHKYV